ncbi:MAG TPA: calcium/sodium antiporter [Geobacter sp.]|nr:MAG: calcium/sodium antiporter [Geobacteraceae bacterium GWF2_54_21]HBA71612.1 calcium/sodium antiporter [Geobacter sp.]HCE67107.1 calcium/sodium antiporter [Geobacter sp.]
MTLSICALVAGLALLVWSADRFVEGAAAVARHFNVPSLLIGMVIVGFGTSAPEMVVSAIASWQGNPGIALGNAYGSNITNIALILGLTAVFSPIVVHSRVLHKELPVLLVVTGFALFLMSDNELSRLDGWLHILVFSVLIGWSILQGLRVRRDALGEDIESELIEHHMPLGRAFIWLTVGLVLLIASSRLLVWGAVNIAHFFGVSDLIIGLTVIAVGTSLPELASSIIAIRKNEHDIALGNVIGSNLFNTLAVIGIVGTIHPLEFEAAIFKRDMLVMALLTVCLFLFCFGFGGAQGRISRLEGLLLLAAYIGYTTCLIVSVLK